MAARWYLNNAIQQVLSSVEGWTVRDLTGEASASHVPAYSNGRAGPAPHLVQITESLTAVDVHELPAWGEVLCEGQKDIETVVVSQIDENFSIRADPKLNSKVVLHLGDICRLNADAVVIFTNDTFDSHESSSGRLSALGGEILRTYIDALEPCKCGEARILAAVNAPCRYLIYTVGPRYLWRYKEAADNSLHCCLRESMKILVETNLRTIAIPAFYTRSVNNYPKDLAVHVFLRTIRRWIELLNDKIDLVVICSDDAKDVEIYHELCPVYFPRNAEEESVSRAVLADVMLAIDEFGALKVIGRQIPITLKQSSSGLFQDSSDSSTNTALSSSTLDIPVVDPSIDKSFVEAKDRTESERRINIDSYHHVLSAIGEEDQSKDDHYYTKCVCEAQRAAHNGLFRQIAHFPFLYFGESDVAGRKVVVFVIAMFPGALDWYTLFLYIIWKVDPYVHDKFTLLLLNTSANSANKPSLQFMRGIYRIFSAKYCENVDKVIVLHPTWTLRILVNVFWTFLPSKAQGELIFCDTLEELAVHIPSGACPVPKFVCEFEKSER